MNITFSDKLKEYLAEKDARALLVSTYQSHGCTGSPEQVIRIIDEQETQDLVAKGTSGFDVEGVQVFITHSWMPDNDDANVEFDVQGFLGTKTIVSKGLKRPELYF